LLMSNYLIDTNIVTALLKDNVDVYAKMQEVVLRGEEILINGITYYEIKRGLLAIRAESKLSKFERFCNDLGVIWLDSQDIFDEAASMYADLKRRGLLIGDADILIAAIARTRDLVLVTTDPDFERLAGIEIQNWL